MEVTTSKICNYEAKWIAVGLYTQPFCNLLCGNLGEIESWTATYVIEDHCGKEAEIGVTLTSAVNQPRASAQHPHKT